MQWLNEKSLTTWGFAFALVILVLIGVVFVVQVVDQQQRSSWITEHQQGVLEIEGVLSSIKDAALGQRGYVITGQNQYLDIYRLAASEIPEQIRSIERLTAENPLQHHRVAELRSLAEDELAAADRSIRLRDEGRLPDSPEQLAATNEVRKSLESGRTLIREIRDEEKALLARRSEESRENVNATIAGIVIGYLAGLGFLVAAFGMLKRELGLRARAESELSRANELLEQRIGERTAELAAANERLSREVADHKCAREEISSLNESLEQRVAERTAELQATNRELESFSYSVSHDLRAPLRAVDGFARMLEEDCGDRLDAEGKRMLGVIRSNSRNMGKLIDDLLAFSRLGRKPIAAGQLDMAALVREASGEIEAFAPHPVRIAVDPMPAGWGDRPLVRQVWANLLANAVKFSQHRENPAVEVGSFVAGAENVYYVRDNGVGFDMRYADKLFGVFQRLHAADEFPGTGVGLAIVHRIVTRHGGRVWAESRPDEGAVFYFTLAKKDEDGRV